MDLVTGAAGFVGSHLVGRLLDSGRTVIGLDNFSDNYSPARKRANLREHEGNSAFRLVEGDVRDPALVASIFSGSRIETVFHLAGLGGVRPSVLDPATYVDVNVGGTAVLLSQASSNGVKRFVMASTSSVYGNSATVPFQEDDPAIDPYSPYAASKRAAELLIRTYSHLCDMGMTILRLFTVYGPRQRPEMAIHHFTRQILAGLPIQVFGAGEMARDYTYVTDVVDGIVASLAITSGFETVNLGGSQPVKLLELVEHLSRICGRPAIVEHVPVPPGDVRVTAADIRRAGALFGYRPRVGIAEGLERFVDWYRRECTPEFQSQRK